MIYEDSRQYQQKIQDSKITYIIKNMMQLNKTQVKEIYPGILLRKKKVKVDEQLMYYFELDVQDLNNIELQAEFSGSQNFSIRGYGKNVTKVIKTIEPRNTVTFAQIQLYDGWKIKVDFRVTRKPISKEKQMVYIKPENDLIDNERKTVQTILKITDVDNTPIEQINEKLASSKMKFVDCDFPPDQFSILGESGKNLIDNTVNHWRRPSDIFEKKYYLIQRISYKNLRMGKLLDYAFFSVVVSMAANDEKLIQRLFFNKKSINEMGLYRLKICKNGEWKTVTIDDFIPCEPMGKPKFASSSEDEIWIHLLQKAYAKVHKRYLALHELEISHVLNDLTGCPTIIGSVEDPEVVKIIIENLKQKNIVVIYDIEQKQYDQEEFLPLRNYAYSIFGYEEYNKKIYFQFISHAVNNTLKQQQIDEVELRKKFKYFCICKVQNWQQLRIKGKFVTVESGISEHSHPIVLSRWYYSLDVQERSEVFVCLHQEDLLIGNNSLYKKYHYVSLVIYQKKEKSKLIPIAFKNYAHNREFQFQLDLKPGTYIILPIINEQVYSRKAPSEKDLIHDIFRKLDLLMRRQLKYTELQPFFKVINEPFDQTIMNQLLGEYTNKAKGLGFDAFSKMWYKNEIYWKQNIVKHYESEKLFILSIHSKEQISVLIKSNIGTEFNNMAHCEMILKFGEDLKLQEELKENIRIRYLRSKNGILQYMAQNKFERKLSVKFECKNSVGYSFIPTAGYINHPLDSGEKAIIMSMIPLEKAEYKHSENQEIISVDIAMIN